MSINVDRFSTVKSNTVKYDQFFRDVQTYHPSAAMLQETGVRWNKMPGALKLGALARQYLSQDTETPEESRVYTAHNVTDGLRSRSQWGGTAVLSHGKCAQHTLGAGCDPTGLARWCWVRYQGKNNVALRVVSLYCPNPPSHQPKQLSVYQQHLKHFNNENDDREPRQAFIEDFETELIKWLETGDQIVVGGDWNHDIFSEPAARPIEDMFKSHNMHNMVFCLHDPNDFPSSSGKTTTQKRTVDGIWGTSGLVPIRAGYIKVGEFGGDHHPIWFDVTFRDALGHVPSKIARPHTNRLNMSNKKAVKRFQDRYLALAREHNLFKRTFALELVTIRHPGLELSEGQVKEANAIDNIKTRCMLEAVKKCRHIRAGAVDHSKTINDLASKVIFWKALIRKKDGSSSLHHSTWKKLKEAANIKEPTQRMSLQTLWQRHHQATKTYLKAKKNHTNLRKKYLEANYSPKELKRRLANEEARRQGRELRRVTGKASSGAVDMVLDGDGIERRGKGPVEKATMDSNRGRYSKCLETPPMQPPFVQDFGYVGDTPAADQVLNGSYVPPPEMNERLQELLKFARRPDNVPENPPCQQFITTEDHQQAWKKAKEKTSAGMSGITFAMFKAAALHPLLASLDAAVRNIAYVSGLVYKRWQQGLNAMLLKNPGNYWVEKQNISIQLLCSFEYLLLP